MCNKQIKHKTKNNESNPYKQPKLKTIQFNKQINKTKWILTSEASFIWINSKLSQHINKKLKKKLTYISNPKQKIKHHIPNPSQLQQNKFEKQVTKKQTLTSVGWK